MRVLAVLLNVLAPPTAIALNADGSFALLRPPASLQQFSHVSQQLRAKDLVNPAHDPRADGLDYAAGVCRGLDWN